MGLFVGIGAVGVGLASLKGIIGGLVEKFEDLRSIAALAENFWNQTS